MPQLESGQVQVGAGVDEAAGSGEEMSLAASVRGWVEAQLRPQGFGLPLIKRLSLVVTGLVRAQSAERGKLVLAIDGLKVTPAEPESIARRVVRTLDDPRLDPERLLPYCLKAQLTILLAELLREHDSSAGDAAHAVRFPLLRIVVDESTKLDDVHILVGGISYQGVVIPLAIRVWKQNQILPPEEYRAHLASLLTSVEEMMPAALRQHVLLLADRAYGRPDFLDLVEALGWHYVIRIQGQTRILSSDEAVVAAREFAPRKGSVWCSEHNPDSWPQPIAAFKGAGWRECHFVAAWAPEAQEPWLLVTDLKATRERFLDYASRWAIERLFLSWKSHGWDVESLQMDSPARLGRYLVAIALATLWTLVCGVAHTTTLVEERVRRRQEGRRAVVQLRLPFAEPTPDHRPWISKLSLLSWGRSVFHSHPCQTSTPPLCWSLPDWHAPVWSTHSQQLLAANP